MDNVNGCMGFGWILRYDWGAFIAAESIPCTGIYTVKEAETFAVREALSWLKEQRYTNCQVEIDALLIL